MNLSYLIPRLARHFMPDNLARALLRRGMIIRPGLETSNPDAAAGRYREILEQAGTSLAGKRVMVFGYGGSFALGCLLLRQGAGHVVLCDKFAPPDDARNALLLPEYADYLVEHEGKVHPLPEFITLLQADIRDAQQEAVDIVLTSSVYEHLDDVEGITRALARLTRPGWGAPALCRFEGPFLQVPVRDAGLFEANLAELAQSHQQPEPLPHP